MAFSVFACTPKTDGPGTDPGTNDNTKKVDALVFASDELDGVFNPFFATSGPDMEVMGMTQLSMLSTDAQGKPAYGADLDTAVLDMTNVPVDERSSADKEGIYTGDYHDYYTTYEFVLKNGIKFSDGSPLTMQDVLFNLYVYLDTSYTGSSTMYSTNIRGLSAYRAQTEDPAQQDQMEDYFAGLAEARVSALLEWTDNKNLSIEAADPIIGADIEIVRGLFKDELATDWSTASASLTDNEYGFTEAWEMYLLFEGQIEWKRSDPNDKDSYYVEWNGQETIFRNMFANQTETQIRETAIGYIFDAKLGGAVLTALKSNLAEIIQYWATAESCRIYFAAAEKEAYFNDLRENNNGKLVVPNVSGITTHKATSFNGKSLDGEHEVLKIVINGVDPKAIWNFGFTVSPMKYYSSAALIAKANAAASGNQLVREDFGVEFGSVKFMDEVVRARRVPVGAGPYIAAKYNGGAADNGDFTAFFNDNIVYYERNEHFLMGVPKVAKIRYQVVNQNNLLAMLQKGDVHYGAPPAKAATVTDITANANLDYVMPQNLGYGYIGVNASFVNDLKVRQAIMHAMNVNLALDYYTNGMASIIHRPMSSVSWAYPETIKEPYYPYDGTGAKSRQLVEQAGWVKNPTDGIYAKMNPITGKQEQLKFTFTIAGESADHPMFATMNDAAQVLNKIGFKITVINDKNALSKLASGKLAVWAAAWGSTIDPDMFQVYHQDSKATSVTAWGYPYIFKNSAYFPTEIGIIAELSRLIDLGRSYLEDNTRKPIYAAALDEVMKLAVELPTYQRVNLFAYRTDVFKVSTLTPKNDVGPYNGLLSRLWEVELKAA
jgi:peptide/nickel transport system substrate-binding protein